MLYLLICSPSPDADPNAEHADPCIKSVRLALGRLHAVLRWSAAWSYSAFACRVGTSLLLGLSLSLIISWHPPHGVHELPEGLTAVVSNCLITCLHT